MPALEARESIQFENRHVFQTAESPLEIGIDAKKGFNEILHESYLEYKKAMKSKKSVFCKKREKCFINSYR